MRFSKLENAMVPTPGELTEPVSESSDAPRARRIVTHKRVAGRTTLNLLDIQQTADTRANAVKAGAWIGFQIENNRSHVAGVAEHIGAIAAIDVGSDCFSIAQLKDIDIGAASEIFDVTECQRAIQIAAVYDDNVPNIRRIRTLQRIDATPPS